MTNILLAILSLSAFGSLLAGLVFLLRPFIKNRVSKAFEYYLWLVVLLRLCLPFGVNVIVPAEWFDREAPATDVKIAEGSGNNFSKSAQAYELMTEGQKDTMTYAFNNTVSVNATSGIISDNISDNISDKRSKSEVLSSWLKSPVIWLIILIFGAMFSLAWHVFGYIRFTSMIRRTAKEPDSDDFLIFSEFNHRDRVRFVRSEFVRTPMLVGFLHPAIVTPFVSYAKSGREENLRDILRHEFTHYHRKDMLYKWFSMAVTSLHWFNPLMILIRREINRACELSCDEAVIRSLDQRQKKHYGETLLSLAARQIYPTGILSTTMCEEKTQLKERLLFIKNYKTKTRTALALSLALLIVFTGCASINGINKKEISGNKTDNSATTQKQQVFSEDVTLYKKYGLTIAIPNEIINQLVIFTEPKIETYKDLYLLSAYEKRSYEAAQIDYPDGYAGYIFSIVRYTQAQYEQFLCSDGSGQSFFAKDGNYYYGWFVPTDVQFYSKDSLYTESDEWKSWILLNEKCNAIKEDFIARNNLIAYSDREFWNKDFTYDSEHIFLKYYPYYAYTGSKEEVWMLILSQPAMKGDKGIWCVERWEDQYGNIYPYFPDENGMPSGEYYSALQAECDKGNNLVWLQPEQVALAFVNKVFEHGAATLDSFTHSDNPYMTLKPISNSNSNNNSNSQSNSESLFSMYIPDSNGSISLNVYPVDFPFGCNLIEKSRTTYQAESFGKTIIVESDGLQVIYLNPYEGVNTVTTIRTNKKDNSVAGIGVGSTEEFLMANWPNKLRKLVDGISYDDEAWFGEYDIAYSYTPEESTKSVVFIIKDGIISGIEIINGLDGPIYMP